MYVKYEIFFTEDLQTTTPKSGKFRFLSYFSRLNTYKMPAKRHLITLYSFKPRKCGKCSKGSYLIWDPNKNSCRRDGIFEKLHVIE